MKSFVYKNRIRLLSIIIGALAGFLYWRFIGCVSGSCPITSNWLSTTIIGGLAGYLIYDSIADMKRKKQIK